MSAWVHCDGEGCAEQAGPMGGGEEMAEGWIRASILVITKGAEYEEPPSSIMDVFMPRPPSVPGLRADGIFHDYACFLRWAQMKQFELAAAPR